jgi:hypothetical protein
MSADLTAAGDQVGCTDLMSAAMPETCGHDMDVPESKFQFVERLSRGSTVGEDLGGHAARMFTPGAVTSGCDDHGTVPQFLTSNNNGPSPVPTPGHICTGV